MDVSVIVPIYNVKLYLDECLQSIINQNFNKTYEVILINDGSTDGSERIAQDYANKYNNVKLINSVNKGLSSARNIGLDNANGDYIVFVDSDDYIKENYLDSLYKNITNNNSDIGICSFTRFSEEKASDECIDLNENMIYSSDDMLKKILEGKVQCYAWNKIYNRELFTNNNIRYPLGKLYEDIVTFINLVINSKRISFTNEMLYQYRIREGSITLEKNKRAVNDLNYAIDQVNKLITAHNLKDVVSREIMNFNIMYTLSSLDMVGVYVQYCSKKFYNEYRKNFNRKYFDYNLIGVIKNTKILNWVKRDYILFRMKLLVKKNKLRDRRV